MAAQAARTASAGRLKRAMQMDSAYLELVYDYRSIIIICK
jgi:hypothetical protein